MKKVYKLLCIVLILSLTSCFEVVERITLRDNGSGSATFTLNMSKSRTKLKSVMKMETVNGKKVPSKLEIQNKVKRVETVVRSVPGISNVKTNLDFENFIGEFSCNFTDVAQLNEVVKAIQSEGLIKKGLSTRNYYYSKEKKEFKRIHEVDLKSMYEKMSVADKKVLEGANYTSVIKFDQPVESYSNQSAKLSKSKKGMLLKSTVLDIINRKKSIENTIKITH